MIDIKYHGLHALPKKNKISCYYYRAQSFTEWKVDVRQDISGGFAFR